MKLCEIKKKILNWEDFYGQDIVDTDKIQKARTRKEFKQILEEHIFFLETQHIDAMTHAENFIKELGLCDI